MLFLVSFTSFVVMVEFFGKMFFVNRTDSMPIGLYIRRASSNIAIGDIIVFRKEEMNIDLIKYVSAIGPSEYCIDKNQTFWIDGIPAVEINTAKYPSKKSDQSQCLPILDGEILALGDHPNSFDGRYFGPIKITDVVARVELLWPFK